MTKPPEKHIGFSHEDYEILNREVLYSGVFRLARYEFRHKLYNGSWSQPVSREVLERLSGAAVLPYDPVLDQVVLIEQFRPGAIASPTSPWLVEIVAGILDSNEPPDKVAVREAQEEAGCTLEALYPICDYFVSPGGANEYIHVYCGKVNASSIGGVHGLEYEHEDIRAFTLPAEEAFDQLRAGLIKTAPAIIALQWLQINRIFLREFWV